MKRSLNHHGRCPYIAEYDEESRNEECWSAVLAHTGFVRILSGTARIVLEVFMIRQKYTATCFTCEHR